jgi:hypothetical protein
MCNDIEPEHLVDTVALLGGEVFDGFGHSAGVAFHEDIPIALQFFQALTTLFQGSQFRPSNSTGFLYLLSRFSSSSRVISPLPLVPENQGTSCRPPRACRATPSLLGRYHRAFLCAPALSRRLNHQMPYSLSWSRRAETSGVTTAATSSKVCGRYTSSRTTLAPWQAMVEVLCLVFWRRLLRHDRHQPARNLPRYRRRPHKHVAITAAIKGRYYEPARATEKAQGH